MGETHNLWIAVDLCGSFGLLSKPLLPEFRWRHPKLRLDTLEGEVVQLLIELFKKLCVCIEAIELSKLHLEPTEKGLLRAVTPGS